eukprot:4336110-Pleurochrysis_carterae.AAC.1
MKASFPSLRRIPKYYTRYELNAARLLYIWPPGHIVPEFGKYVDRAVEIHREPVAALDRARH